MKPLNNYVLLKPLMDNTKMDTKAGEMFVDPTWLPENHGKVLCEVIAVPDQLIFSKKAVDYSMEWETKMMLEVGDIVVINYLLAIIADERQYIMVEDEKLFYVPYDKIYYIKKEMPVMLNGYTICSWIKEDMTGLMQHKTQGKYKDVLNERLALVEHAGEANTNYLVRKEYDDIDVVKGDVVITAFKNYKFLQSDIHKVLNSDKHLFVLLRRQMTSKIVA